MAPKVDFIAQFAGFVAVVYALIVLSLGERDFWTLILEGILLVWQLGSAIVWVIALRKHKTRARKLTVVALIAIPLYIVALVALGAVHGWMLFTVWLFIVWWPVALYSFTLTTMRAFGVALDKTTPGDIATE